MRFFTGKGTNHKAIALIIEDGLVQRGGNNYALEKLLSFCLLPPTFCLLTLRESFIFYKPKIVSNCPPQFPHLHQK
jgi:hypothetical protein